MVYIIQAQDVQTELRAFVPSNSGGTRASGLHNLLGFGRLCGFGFRRSNQGFQVSKAFSRRVLIGLAGSL